MRSFPFAFMTAAAAAAACAVGACSLFTSFDEFSEPASDSGSINKSDAGGDGSPSAFDGSSTPVTDGGDGGGSSVDQDLCSDPTLALCLRFENNLADDSKSHAVATSIKSVTFIPGRTGQAIHFTSDSELQFNVIPAAIASTPELSIELWIRQTKPTGSTSVLFDMNYRFAVVLNGNGSVACATESSYVGFGFVAEQAWTHLACVFDGKDIVGYINGKMTGKDAGSLTIADGGIAIGADWPVGDHFIGDIDSLRVFSSVRDANQIAAGFAKQ